MTQDCSSYWTRDHPGLSPRTDLDEVRRLLGGTDLDHPESVRYCTELLGFLDLHPDAADRTCRDGHLTGSALVVDSAGERTLLMLHRKLGRWFQPGGHADGDTNLVAVALREAAEETGITGLMIDPRPIDVDIHRVDPPLEHPHLHLDVRFVVVAPPGAIETANEESLGLCWVTAAELDVLEPAVDASTRRLVELGLTARHRRWSDRR